MSFEWWLLLLSYVVTTAIFFFIPRHKIRPAVVAFLFTHIITFLPGLLVVEFGLLEYPVRLFASIDRASFTFEYYVFPVICSFFYVWFPHDQSHLIKFGYYSGFTTVLTIVEIIIEKYTDLINYIHWEWYTTWITIYISFYIVRLFCDWFFNKGKA